jgi:hypothetical protein
MGAIFDDVVFALKPWLLALEEGMRITIRQTNAVVYAFPLAYTADVPQQAKNSNFRGHNALFACRYCLIPAEGRGKLDYDII